jgi:hypothetical protein
MCSATKIVHSNATTLTVGCVRAALIRAASLLLLIVMHAREALTG